MSHELNCKVHFHMHHLIDAFHPSLLQIHLGAEEVGVFAVIAGHLEIDVHSVCRTDCGHWRQERKEERCKINAVSQ